MKELWLKKFLFVNINVPFLIHLLKQIDCKLERLVLHSMRQ
jgi:hypothetical protein